MDYEKKYKEALERAKKFEEKYGGGYAEYIFPELAESEDERIKKTIRQLLETARDAHSNTSLAKPFIDALAWLEKQKEPENTSASTMAPSCWEVEQKEQKPDTRDADDLQLLGFIYDLLNEIEWKDNWAMSKDECLRRLNNYRPQKPVSISCGHENDAEWSGEDERIRLACIATINDVIDYERDRWEDYNPGKPYRPITKYDEQIDWLKSLRPQYHGDVTMTEAYKMGLEAGKASSWKPSEEQMAALEAATVRYQSTGLESLYEELKKL